MEILFLEMFSYRNHVKLSCLYTFKLKHSSSFPFKKAVHKESYYIETHKKSLWYGTMGPK